MGEEPEITDFKIVSGEAKTGFLFNDFECLPEEAHLLKV